MATGSSETLQIFHSLSWTVLPRHVVSVHLGAADALVPARNNEAYTYHSRCE